MRWVGHVACMGEERGWRERNHWGKLDVDG